MNYDQMPEGREMDRTIAEQVIGWRWMDVISGRPPIMMPPEQWERYKPEFQQSAWVKDYDGNPPERLPRFSTEIADAWLVVEKMGERFDISISRASFGEGERRYECVIEKMDTDHMLAFYIAETAQLAICRAALKAISITELK